MGKKNTSKIIIYVLNIIISLLILGPIIYTLCVSIMSPEQIFEYPPKIIPRKLFMENYKEALETAPILKFILNSLIMSVSITVGQVITGILAAYAFAFMNFKGKKVLFIIILSTLMIPGQAVIIANYLTISSLGLLDTFRALILPYLTSALAIFLFRQFFLTLPKELYEAAILDGCGNFRFLINVVIPLSKPAIGSLGIYSFLQAWNMYMWPLLTTNCDNMRTVQIGMGMLQDVDAQAFGPLMAGIIMIIIPSILAFVLGQKQLIEGLTSGSVKS
ncbi:carbohydrate ABC transporter permease [Clostridium ganghwense]|uniref:Carbohydrate ABC transporter permease n=1 Tax=Clostridium ganghwense TaxID=312089 RepID=A0ABT4CP16_9CLOT|nr:carbohydrate ABC transporter permease [Clostridium ganghwense]MCY6370800.1 carbohydrate ABC transporter permease [Clostridium ganghwense]